MSMYRTDVPREIIIILRVSYHVCESTNECIISALLLVYHTQLSKGSEAVKSVCTISMLHVHVQ